MKSPLSKTAINLAATNHAKQELGPDQFKKNKDAVKAIKATFIDAVEWTMRQNFVESPMAYGHDRITSERMQQIIRGYDEKHDDRETKGQLAQAAALYAAEDTGISKVAAKLPWPWPDNSYPDKRGKLDRVRQLVIAGALIAAEIDRLIRKSKPAESEVANV